MYDKEEINIVISVLQAPRQLKEITESKSVHAECRGRNKLHLEHEKKKEAVIKPLKYAKQLN